MASACEREVYVKRINPAARAYALLIALYMLATLAVTEVIRVVML